MTAEDGPFLVPRDPYLRGTELRWSGGESELHFAPRERREHVFWARNAIFHALRTFGVGSGEEVLVPAYICAAAVEPVAATGALPVFFDVDRACRPRLADIEARITPRTRALIAVHYFGFPQPIAELRALCDRRGLRLIEDCAHVLRGHADGARLGSFGDAAVFSWRKFLPVNDGGELVLREPLPRSFVTRREPWTFTARACKNVLDRAADARQSALLRLPDTMLSWLRRRPAARASAAAGAPAAEDAAAAPTASEFDGDVPDPLSLSFDATQAGFPMSRVSRWILARADIARAVSIRRRNYRYLADRLARLDGVTLLHRDLAGDVCPWVLPVFFPGRRDVHVALRARGIPAATWGGVRPPQLPAGAFPDAEHLYDALVFLPMHQGLADADLDLVCSVVAEALTATRATPEPATLPLDRSIVQ